MFHSWGTNQDYGADWNLTVQPSYHSFTFTVPVGAQSGWLSLAPQSERPGVNTYFSQVSLRLESAPSAPNDLRGAELNFTWPGVRPWADAISQRIFPDQGRLSFILYTLLDWPGTGWYYRSVAVILLRTFWAVFSWGHVYLNVAYAYSALALITVAGLVGGFFYLLARRRQLPWAELTFLGLSLLLVWGFTFVRGSIYLEYPNRYYPVARYAYPVIIPTLLWLVGGWWLGYRALNRLTAIWHWQIPKFWAAGLYILFFLALNTLSIFSIVRFYG